ncbi:MAG TPA: AAA family ATPase, partial [Dehalococcoidia bacterium]|nr:AAA family ATPase [Dehalococcoidia bacterium]
MPRKEALFYPCGGSPSTVTRGFRVLLDDPVSLTVERRDALGLRNCDDLKIATPDKADLSDSMALLDAIHAQCKAFKPQLIVIDALYLFTPSRQNAGNDSASMGPVMAKLNAIAEALQAAVLLIAHDKKDGSDVAGSHVIRAAVKARLHLTRPQWGGTDEEADDGKRYLTVTTKMTAETKHLLRCQGA